MLLTTPASTSAWLTVCTAAVQVVVEPGVSEVNGQLTGPAVGSVTPTDVSVVVPALVTLKVQVIVSPRSVLKSPLTSLTAAFLTSLRFEVRVTAVSVCELLEVVVAPAGVRPVAVAVLLTTPASTSAWTIA